MRSWSPSSLTSFSFPTSKRSPTRRWFLSRLTFSLGAQLLKGRLGGGAVPLLVSDSSGARCAWIVSAIHAAWIASAIRAPRDGVRSLIAKHIRQKACLCGGSLCPRGDNLTAMAQNHWLDAQCAVQATVCFRVKWEWFLRVDAPKLREPAFPEQWLRRRWWQYQQEFTRPGDLPRCW